VEYFVVIVLQGT